MTTNLRAFTEIEKRFHQKLRDAIAEVRAKDPADQDWSRITKMNDQYGGFLDLFPEATDAPRPPALKRPKKTDETTS